MSPKPFTEFELHPDLLAGLEQMGYTHATPVQDAAIPLVQTGKDLMVQARTGTGKTLGFGLPTLQRIEPANPDTQVLVICPTRELALQVSDELSRVAERMQIIVAAVFGGVKIETQIDQMQWAPVVVGTPGRLRDHIERGFLHLDTCKVVVLDEADEMLDMGFKDDLEFILKRVPAEQRQTLLFSATFPPEIAKIAQKYMRSPEKIEVSSGFTPAVGLTHKFARVPKDKKIQALGTLLRGPEIVSAIIFCETKVEAAWVHQRLKREGLSIGILTGDIPQEKRLVTLQQFRDSDINVLVATDVAARGLDIPAVSHVFHFTVPRDTATYIHRSGRTARAGKKGIAFTLVTAEEERDFQTIMRDLKQQQGGTTAPQTRNAPPAGGGHERRPQPAPGQSARGERPAHSGGPRPDGRGPRLNPAQAGMAAQIFQAIATEATASESFRGLVDALMSRGDSRRIVAALLSLSPQAEAWLEVADAPQESSEGPRLEGAGFEGGRRDGRRRRRGGRGRGGRFGSAGEGSAEGFSPREAPGEVSSEAASAPRVTEPVVQNEAPAEDKPARSRSRSVGRKPAPAAEVASAAPEAPEAPAAEKPAPKTRRATTKKAAEAPVVEAAAEAAPVKRTRTTRAAKTAAAPAAEAAAPAEAPKKRASRAKKVAEPSAV
ncbi:MAG: DEAD/DEAH box helicase [Candidatus Sericytochromatia bacterium]|nr:DEAD/DEAH box helicase [Candidatus Sericytochromatia bacterium]